MIIIDPVALGDVACTRASTATYYDRNGVLQTAPANTIRVTYDPSDLSKAPYALIEQAAATNVLTFSEQFDNAAWGRVGGLTVTPNTGAAPDGNLAMDTLNGVAGVTSYLAQIFNTIAQTDYGVAVFMRAGTSGSTWVRVFNSGQSTMLCGAIVSWADGVPSIDVLQGVWSKNPAIAAIGNGVYQLKGMVNAQAFSALSLLLYPSTNNKAENAQFWGAHVQIGEVGSYIPTTAAAVTRAADVIAAGAGLVYSNVAIAETAYSAGATYALDAVVYDPATYLTYQSLIAANTGKALTDTTSWTPLKKVVNRWLMFDPYNNTQTSNAEEILVVVSPQAIAQGIYFGNVDANEARISCVDLTDGLVYREVQNLVLSNSGSSFYNWFFKRIKKKTYAVTVQLPPYANALVTIAIKKPGGTPKCGVCAIGPLVDVGLSQYGLSREIKDYSTVNFNFDGTSNVELRNFAKILNIDVIVPNDQIDSVTEELENNYRQKPVAWIGAAGYGCACLFGPYVSFKTVIPYPTESAVNLQIQATV
jgi:hypothetical protein